VIRANEMEGSPSSAKISYLIVVCAYNEAPNLPHLLDALSGHPVLVVDDGSVDGTSEVARRAGVLLITHESRLGKTIALRDGVGFALERGYDVVVDLGGDAIPESGSVQKLIAPLQQADVGGSSCRQIPMRSGSAIAYSIDEVLWGVLAKGKELQMSLYGDSYLGAVMFAFKVGSMRIEGGTNDDEIVGSYLRSKGLRIIYVKDSIAYFDASSNIHHIIDRRVRMNFGHYVQRDSGAPSAAFVIAAVSLFNAARESKGRIPWIVPAICLETLGKLWAWHDFRKRKFSKYARWKSPDKSRSPLIVTHRKSG
jgi:glycosyltransferase involved in cell wall biosynthesis